MKDNDPRPMPPQVLAAYRDPMNLKGLLISDAFYWEERTNMVGELLDILVKKHGNVEIMHQGREISVRDEMPDWIPSLAVDALMKVSDYGGKEGVLLELARVMQPYWLRWWGSFEWIPLFIDWGNIAAHVLSRRQLTWIAAQAVRSVIEQADRGNLKLISKALQDAERWSADPSKKNRATVVSAGVMLNALANGESVDGRAPVPPQFGITNSAAAASNVLRAAAYVTEIVMARDSEEFYYDKVQFNNAIGICAFSGPARPSLAGASEEAIQGRELASKKSREKLLRLVRSLITPTLITSPSRGIR